jgi:hypothetical protein
MPDELKIIQDYFVDLIKDDAEFLALFGEDNLAPRVGQPLAEQGARYPLINIRDLGGYDGSVLRSINSGVDYLWIQRKVLVVAVNDSRRYPAELAARMFQLFKLTATASVDGGVVYHCYLSREEGHYKSQYPDAKGKIYSERGAFWIIAAKAT